MLMYQSKHFGTEEDVSFFHLNEVSFIPHLHRSIELIYVKKGRMELSIFDEVYSMKENDFALVLPYQIHNFQIYEDSIGYFTVISLDHIPYLTKLSQGKRFRSPVFCFEEPISKEMENCLFFDDSDLFLFESHLYRCCSKLMKGTNLMESDTKEYNLLHSILTYSQEHFMEEDLTLAKVAAKFGYNKQYIARYIKEALGGVSFSEFLNGLRVNHAVYLLTYTDKNVTEICSLCGYNTIRSFNRNFFENINVTPTEYRRNIIDNC